MTIHDSPLLSEQKRIYRASASQLVEWKLSTKGETEFDKYKKTEMLSIDDLGIEPITAKLYGNESTPIIDLLYYRYDWRLFTIITSNLDEQGLDTMYGPRIADRFREMFDRIAYTNASYRK